MLDLMYETPSRSDIKRVVVTKNMIEEKEQPLQVVIETRKKKKEESA
jgi:ATP-dependent Clp protease ATP-binding subunit ClpX